MLLPRADRAAAYVLASLRIVASLVLLQHGLQKTLHVLSSGAAQPSFDLTSRSGVAGVLEVIGPVLLILGIFTRPTAFILAGEMAFAYFLVHAKQSAFPVLNRGESPVLLCFVFLAIFALGPGALSIDGALAERRRLGELP